MNETQKLIKSTIENSAKQQYGIDIVVEYVADVSERTQELQQECGEKFNSVYTAEHCTGAFIPTVNNNPCYILIQEDRESMLDVMTAFHEYRHLIDFVLFFKTVANNNIDILKKSPLYTTFNVYSEYAATMYGTKEYIDIVKLGDMSQKELAEAIFQQRKTTYWNLEGIDNRYQLLVHSVQYLGEIFACGQFTNKIDIQASIREMELSSEMCPIFNHIFMYEDKYQWYEKLNRIMRDFVDGGIKN